MPLLLTLTIRHLRYHCPTTLTTPTTLITLLSFSLLRPPCYDRIRPANIALLLPACQSRGGGGS